MLLASYIVAVVCLVVGDCEVGEVAQTQHALQHIVRPPQQEGLPPARRKRERLRCRETQELENTLPFNDKLKQLVYYQKNKSFIID